MLILDLSQQQEGREGLEGYSLTCPRTKRRREVRPPTACEEYKLVMDRIMSFDPERFPERKAYAEEGFFYKKDKNLLVCHMCQIGLMDWRPYYNHLRLMHWFYSSKCLLVREAKQRAEDLYSDPFLRAKSFEAWPHAAVDGFSPWQLAEQGFYYEGQWEEVACFRCGISLSNWWLRRGTPLIQHLRESARQRSGLQCPMARETSKGFSMADPRLAPGLTLIERGLATGCEFLRFLPLKERISSYTPLWPESAPSPAAMADAGFFYTNKADRVKCVYCGLGLSRWRPTDDPLAEHRWWDQTGLTPDCSMLGNRIQFLKQMGRAVPCKQDPTVTSADLRGRELRAPGGAALQRGLPPCTGLEGSGFRSLARTHKGRLYPEAETKEALKTYSATYGVSGDLNLEYLVSIILIRRQRARPSEGSNGLRGELRPGGGGVVSEYVGRLQAYLDQYLTTTRPRERECIICYDQPATIGFVPCGHVCTCSDCSLQVTRCVLCRGFIFTRLSASSSAGLDEMDDNSD